MELIQENYKLRQENDLLKKRDYKREKSLLRKAEIIRDLRKKLNAKKKKAC